MLRRISFVFVMLLSLVAEATPNAIRMAYNFTTVSQTVVFNSAMQAGGTFTLSNFTHYLANEAATPTTTNSQVCFWANSTIISGINNFGFRGSLPSNTNNWNLYMEGAAKNYLAGNTLIGTTTDAGFKLDVSGTFRTSGSNTLSNLAGTGTRMVVASSTGVLSTQTIPTGSSVGFEQNFLLMGA
jgi:hypothetical protein